MKQAVALERSTLDRELLRERRATYARFFAEVGSYRHACWAYLDGTRNDPSSRNEQWSKLVELWTTVSTSFNAVELEGPPEVEQAALHLMEHVRKFDGAVTSFHRERNEENVAAFNRLYNSDTYDVLRKDYAAACRSGLAQYQRPAVTS